MARLYIKDLKSNEDFILSNGATHPIFLTQDSIAYSHYYKGKQILTLCSLSNNKFKSPSDLCNEKTNDSLVGFYALSRSHNGILFNATDTAGKTSIYEFSNQNGFTKIIPDSMNAEFPVEAKDGSIWMLKDKDGLSQVEIYNREKNYFSQSSHYPLGTFYLHKVSDGKIASVIQITSTKPSQTRPEWNLRPTQPMFDSLSSDSASQQPTQPSYNGPAFLSSRLPKFESMRDKAQDETPGSLENLKNYNSLLEMRPLILTPFIIPNYPSVSLGCALVMEDPLMQHHLNVAVTSINEGLGYNLQYVNEQTPVTIIGSASNLTQFVDSILPAPGWQNLDFFERDDLKSLEFLIPFPLDLPLPHLLQFGLSEDFITQKFQVGGRKNTADSNEVTKLSLLDFWSLQVQDFSTSFFLHYLYQRPYAYNFVHPLLMTELGSGVRGDWPHIQKLVYLYARQTYPLYKELTHTLWYRGSLKESDVYYYSIKFPDGYQRPFTLGRGVGYYHDFYTSLAFPIVKGYIGEVPIFGLVNYLGGSIFGRIGQEAYDYNSNISRIVANREIVGAKIVSLVHPLRRIPLSLSETAQYDFVSKTFLFKLDLEMSGLPNSSSIHLNQRR